MHPDALVPVHPSRKMAAFSLDPAERWIFAATVGGDLLTLDAENLTPRAETFGHAASIECVAVHPSLPYLATLAIDYTVSLWDRSQPLQLRKLQTIRLRDIRVPGYEFSATLPFSCPLAFHPREQRLATHNADGALVELEFDDTSVTTRFAVGLFRESPAMAYDIDYVRYLVGSEHLFCSTFGGHVAVVDPRSPEEPRLRWRYDKRTIHCAEHLEADEYLLASDTRRVIRFDMSGAKEPLVGPTVVRDHLEQISHNRTSGRVFGTSFDRTVVEIDPVTCSRQSVVLETPFKLRWMHSFERDPDRLLVQCRNGALYQADLGRRRPTAVFKQTPNALWTAARTAPDEVVIAGEGPDVLHVRALGADPATHETTFDCRWSAIEGAARGSYAKRLVVHAPTRALVQGRSDGQVLVTRGGATRSLLRLPSPLRDIDVSPEGFDLFSVTEDGGAQRIDLETGEVRARFQTEEEPLWSLAYNHPRRLLAVCERQGSLYILGADDLGVRLTIQDSWAPKRMRWRDSDRLLVGRGADLFELDVRQGEMVKVIPRQGNTIEDFCWDDQGRFLALVTYARRVHLFDLTTWTALDVLDFDLDFPKGLCWLSPERAAGAHPHELLVFGRSGVAKRYRVHDERLHDLGVVNTVRSLPISDDAGVVLR